MIVIIILLGLYLAFGVFSLIYYLFDFVIPVTKTDGFDPQMIIVMLMALFLPPLYWFIGSLIKNNFKL